MRPHGRRLRWRRHAHERRDCTFGLIALAVLSSAPTAAADDCQGWCAGHDSPWTEKCGWSALQCSACLECTPSPPAPPTPYFPTGPYITPETASELVTLAEPATDAAEPEPTNCPHHAQGLLDWHDEATWGASGVPLSSQQEVILPENAKVLLSQSPNDLSSAIIQVPPSSELVIGEHEPRGRSTVAHLLGSDSVSRIPCLESGPL